VGLVSKGCSQGESFNDVYSLTCADSVSVWRIVNAFDRPIRRHATGNDDTCVYSDNVMRFVMAVTHVSVSKGLGL
jgi:hypothetical protein